MRTAIPTLLALVVGTGLPATSARAQSTDHRHEPGMTHETEAASEADRAMPAGQAAFEALADVVRRLDANPETDWSRVDIEALRRHLVDMDRVTLESAVRATEIAGGARFDVTGEGRVAESIRRMTIAHARMLDGMPDYEASAEEIPSGARLVVRAHGDDPAGTARIRALGYIGLLTLGNHHGPHHLLIAGGAAPPGH